MGVISGRRATPQGFALAAQPITPTSPYKARIFIQDTVYKQ